MGSQEPVCVVRTFECRVSTTILCFVFFLKPLIYVLKKSQFQKTIYELYLVWKRPSILCLYCANTPYVTGFFAQEKTELKQLWIEFFTRLKFTSFKIFRMEKQIISVDGWWKQDPCSLFQKRRNSSFSFWGTSFILIDFLPLPSVDFFFHSQQFFLYLV